MWVCCVSVHRSVGGVTSFCMKLLCVIVGTCVCYCVTRLCLGFALLPQFSQLHKHLRGYSGLGNGLPLLAASGTHNLGRGTCKSGSPRASFPPERPAQPSTAACPRLPPSPKP